MLFEDLLAQKGDCQLLMPEVYPRLQKLIRNKREEMTVRERTNRAKKINFFATGMGKSF